jgi:hypothetical protein
LKDPDLEMLVRRKIIMGAERSGLQTLKSREEEEIKQGEEHGSG